MVLPESTRSLWNSDPKKRGNGETQVHSQKEEEELNTEGDFVTRRIGMENDHVSIENRWDVGLIDLGNRDRWRGYIVYELQFWETPQERVVGLEGLDGFVHNTNQRKGVCTECRLSNHREKAKETPEKGVGDGGGDTEKADCGCVGKVC